MSQQFIHISNNLKQLKLKYIKHLLFIPCLQSVQFLICSILYYKKIKVVNLAFIGSHLDFIVPSEWASDHIPASYLCWFPAVITYKWYNYKVKLI